MPVSAAQSTLVCRARASTRQCACAGCFFVLVLLGICNHIPPVLPKASTDMQVGMGPVHALKAMLMIAVPALFQRGFTAPTLPCSATAFTSLQVDIDRVRADNESRDGVHRKCGLIIYGGPPPSRQLKETWRREARQR